MESYVGVKRKNVVVGGDVGREMPVAPPSSSSAAVGMVEFPAAAAGLGYAGMTAKEAGGGYQERRVVVGEMDFFKTAEKRGERKEPPPATATAAASGHAGASPDDLSLNKDDLTINMGLLVGRRRNSGSEESIVDDGGVSSNDEEHREAKALAVTKAEIGRLSEENKRLKNMLSNVTTKYNSLQMQFVTLMQQRRSVLAAPIHQQELLDPEKKEQEGSQQQQQQLIPRQFISLGSASLQPDVEAPHSVVVVGGGGGDVCAPSSSNPDAAVPAMMPLPHFDHHNHHHPIHGGRERGSSPAEADHHRHHQQEQPPPPPQQQQLPPSWLPADKVPRFLPGKGPEPVPEAATMRKARVSVRARSDAPMVSAMGANGGSTGRRWRRETLARARTTGAPWPPAARCGSRSRGARRTGRC
uniref:Uncharacterized protein n=1 Tax=Oryza glaberrima TaxID=4538 RepID=I1PY09_ORYGL